MRSSSPEKIICDIKRRMHKQYSAKEKIRIVLDGLRSRDRIAGLCRREGIARSPFYRWSKGFDDGGLSDYDLVNVSAVICSEIKPIRNMMTAALRVNMLIFVNRPIVM